MTIRPSEPKHAEIAASFPDYELPLEDQARLYNLTIPPETAHTVHPLQIAAQPLRQSI